MVKRGISALVLPFSGDNPFFLTSDEATSTTAPESGWKTCSQLLRRCELQFARIRRLDPTDQAERRQHSQRPQSPISSTATENGILSQCGPNAPNKALRTFTSRER
jgi:hypothetical protein